MNTQKSLEEVLEEYHIPRREEFRACYERNCQALLNYPLWRHELPQFSELSFHLLDLGDGNYSYYDWISQTFGDCYQLHGTKAVEKSFFHDLSEPLLIKDEVNPLHLFYLRDQVRASEDYGGDNHIYLYYEDLYLFLSLLQTFDIRSILLGVKFVFLFGTEDRAKNYPLDFHSLYGIDYNATPPQPLRVDEIQKIVVNWATQSRSGVYLLGQLLDFHPHLLTIKEFGMGDFSFLYDEFLCGKNVEEMLQALAEGTRPEISGSFRDLFTPSVFSEKEELPVPDMEDFFIIFLQFLPGGRGRPERIG